VVCEQRPLEVLGQGMQIIVGHFHDRRTG
jgi:hypothetical protein